jgi:hypothetical protein
MSKGLVSKATSDDVKPVTGLQLKNLAGAFRLVLSSFPSRVPIMWSVAMDGHATDATSDANECDVIREALLSRLEDSSPFVKFKALRIIKHVAAHGRAEFRMELQRGSGNQLIKDCLGECYTRFCTACFMRCGREIDLWLVLCSVQRRASRDARRRAEPGSAR